MTERREIDGLALCNAPYTLLHVIDEQIALTEGSIKVPGTEKLGVKIAIFPLRSFSVNHQYVIEREVVINDRSLHLAAFNPEGCYVEIEDTCVIHSIPMSVMQVMSILARRANEKTHNVQHEQVTDHERA